MSQEWIWIHFLPLHQNGVAKTCSDWMFTFCYIGLFVIPAVICLQTFDETGRKMVSSCMAATLSYAAVMYTMSVFIYSQSFVVFFWEQAYIAK